jgi:hypothetical protein
MDKSLDLLVTDKSETLAENIFKISLPPAAGVKAK